MSNEQVLAPRLPALRGSGSAGDPVPTPGERELAEAGIGQKRAQPEQKPRTGILLLPERLGRAEYYLYNGS